MILQPTEEGLANSIIAACLEIYPHEAQQARCSSEAALENVTILFLNMEMYKFHVLPPPSVTGRRTTDSRWVAAVQSQYLESATVMPVRG
jgi:hypothetical protein